MLLINTWLKYQGIRFLEKVGIKKDYIVFDCFCGEGNYTIPAARLVGSSGWVYALDRDNYKIETLRKRAADARIKNIEIINEEFSTDLPLNNKSIDVVLLYDVFWYYFPEDKELALLLNEIHRLIRDEGFLSVYPEHIDCNSLQSAIEQSGFIVTNQFYTQLVHDNGLKRGYILNFKKKQKSFLISFL